MSKQTKKTSRAIAQRRSRRAVATTQRGARTNPDARFPLRPKDSRQDVRAGRNDHEPVIVPDDDPVPADIEEFRRALIRKMLNLARMWRRCREPLCRRHKRCLGADFRCHRDNPVRLHTPDQEARIKAELKRALQRRLGTAT